MNNLYFILYLPVLMVKKVPSHQAHRSSLHARNSRPTRLQRHSSSTCHHKHCKPWSLQIHTRPQRRPTSPRSSYLTRYSRPHNRSGRSNVSSRRLRPGNFPRRIPERRREPGCGIVDVYRSWTQSAEEGIRTDDADSRDEETGYCSGGRSMKNNSPISHL